MAILGICNSCGRTVTDNNLFLQESGDKLEYYVCSKCGDIISMVIKKYLKDLDKDVSGK